MRRYPKGNSYSWKSRIKLEPLALAQIVSDIQILEKDPIIHFMHGCIEHRLRDEMEDLLYAVKAKDAHAEAQHVGRIEVLRLLCEEGFGFIPELHEMLETRRK